MNSFEFSNLNIKSVVKVHNKFNQAEIIKYSNYLEYFQLIYVLNGRAEFVFNNTVMINSPGTIVLLPAGKCENYMAKIIEDEDCIAVFFTTDKNTKNKLYSRNFFNNVNITSLFEKIHQIWLKKETGYYNKSLSIFYDILFEIEKTSSKYMPTKNTDKINNAVYYIHEHYTEQDFEYNKLHTLCNISYTYFKKLFVARFGTTPSNYIKSLKIQRACDLLLAKEFSVTEIAQICGFSDVYYFSKIFKSCKGVSPSQYLKQNVNNT